MTTEERDNPIDFPKELELFRTDNLTSQRPAQD